MSTNKKENKNQIKIREFDEEKLGDEIGKVIQKNDLENYKKGKVGFCSYSDASAAIGGGRAHFLWFHSYHDLYQFLADYFVVLAPGRYDLDHEAVFKKVVEIVQQLAAGETSKDKAISQINDAAKHFSQIEWVGEIEDLTGGSSEFAKKIREYFYENIEEPIQNKVSNKDFPRFVKALEEYGI